MFACASVSTCVCQYDSACIFSQASSLVHAEINKVHAQQDQRKANEAAARQRLMDEVSLDRQKQLQVHGTFLVPVCMLV